MDEFSKVLKRDNAARNIYDDFFGGPSAPGKPPVPGDPMAPLPVAGGSGEPAKPDAASNGTAAAEEAEAEPPKPTLEEAMAELDELIGLDVVKKDVDSLVNLVKVRKLRQERGMKTPEMSFHLVFSGNPGTARTPKWPY